MNDDQRMMYSQLISMNNLDVSLYWTRTQLFFAIQSAGIYFVHTQITSTEPRIVACVLGIYIAGVWWLVLSKVEQFIGYWQRKLAELEREASAQVIQIFNDEEFRETQRRGGPDVYYLIRWLIGIFMVIWLLLALPPLFP